MNKDIFFVFAFSLILGAGSPAGARILQVNIQSFAFHPSADSVAVGDTIQWTNLDGVTHTATSTSGPVMFDSGDLTQNQSYQFQFTVAGHYDYHCSIHTSMLGTVDVMPTGVEQGASQTPNPGLTMMQNQPNPFTDHTAIAFQLPREERVTLEVYDLLGKRVASLVEGTMKSGRYEVTWRGRNSRGEPVASGVYFYRLSAEGKTMTHTLILMR